MKKQILKNQKTLILLLLILLLSGGGYYAFAQNNKQSAGNSEGNNSTSSEETKKTAEDSKQEVIEKNENSSNSQPSTGTKKGVKPVITYADQYGDQVEVSGYVPGVFEEGGTCTATFTQNASSFNKAVSAVRSANSVNCPLISASVNEFASKGSWSVVISYDSKSAAGASETKQINIQ